MAGVESPPPGAGFRIVTLKFPGDWISVAVIVAVSWLLLTYVVTRGDPFHCTTELGTKFDPDTLIVKAGPPTAAELEAMPVKTGAGLGKTSIVTALEDCVPGLLAVMERVPTDVRSAAGNVKYTSLASHPVMLKEFPFT